jgi:hypothetical protein
MVKAPAGKICPKQFMRASLREVGPSVKCEI